MLSFGSTPDWKSISAIRKVPGSVEPTKTLTGCCGSTFPKVRTSADTLSESSTQWLSPSTADLERRSAGERQPKHSTSSCEDEINQLLAPHRAPISDAFASDCTAMKILKVRCDRRLRCDDQLSLGSTPATPSASGVGKRASCPRWARWGMPTTTRWRRASSPRSSAKCSTAGASRARRKRRWRSLIGWKVGITHIADTPRWVAVRPSTTSATHCRARRPDMRSPASHGLICRGILVAGTPAIAAPGASYAVDFPRLLENDELLPPAATDSPAGKIDEHREEE